ncbi:MAG: hypothetical protein SFW35_05500 [Chitinophagales bacterium]|nr:hypothetical protein [Chitinophagales bacterium]
MSIKQLFLVLHIFCGAASLVVGLIPMLVAKGNPAHRRWGKIYAWAMLGVFVTSIILSTALPLLNGERLNFFLFVVGIFSYYFVFTGIRALKHSRPPKYVLPQWPDRLAAVLLAIASLGLLIYGVLFARFNPIIMVFGLVGIGLAMADLWQYRNLVSNKPDKRRWFFTHMGRILGSYIAAFTAFLVVNIHFLPPIVVWLGPGIIGSIGISFWANRYRKKFEATKMPLYESSTDIPV